MKYIRSCSTDIAYNLALEEYILNNYTSEDYFILWKSDTCLVLGRNQNVFEEVDMKEAEKRGTIIVRRNSGGGTVFHDKGNLNFSFITDYDPESFSGYDQFLTPIIKCLGELGIKAEKRNACDLVVDGLKISGNAQTIKKNRILHHGTLLFDADLDSLRCLLKPEDCNIMSKAIKSVRSHVVNLRTYTDITIDEFETHILDVIKYENNAEELLLPDKATEEIERIRCDKYGSWQWNYGKSPEFVLRKKNVIYGSEINVELHVKHGVILSCRIRSADNKNKWEDIQQQLTNQKYSYSLVKSIAARVFDDKSAETVADCFI